MTWQSVGTHTFVPTDQAVQVGSFDLAAGQDTIWVRITQLNDPGDWPWSYGILSWRNANGTPLGSIKAYSNRLGEVFRLGNGLAPLDGVGSIWFEPRGFNLGWLKAGFPWELSFEAQAGASDLTSGYWNRDPQAGVITPKTSGDNLDMTPGWIKAKSLILTDGTGASVEKEVPGYQQGTWTPQLQSGSATYSACTWSRVGYQIQVTGYISQFTDTTSTTQLLVLAPSLPYVPALPADNVTIGSCLGSKIGRQPNSVGLGKSGNFRFERSGDTNQDQYVTLTHADVRDNTSFLTFSASYITSDTSWSPVTTASLFRNGAPPSYI